MTNVGTLDDICHYEISAFQDILKSIGGFISVFWLTTIVVQLSGGPGQLIPVAPTFFAVDARCDTFSACREQGIPAVTAAPLGMGVALLNFLPGKMSFEEYFQLQGQSEQEQLLRFLLGLSPAMLQRSYLVEPDTVDFARHRGPGWKTRSRGR